MPMMDLFFVTLYLSLFVAWVVLVLMVFVDIFRSPDYSGWAKALWVLFVLAVPFIGVVVYVVMEGDRMRVRSRDLRPWG